MIKEMNTFNNQLFSMSIEDLNNTKDLIADIIKNKVKSVMKVGLKVNVVQKTKNRPKAMRSATQSVHVKGSKDRVIDAQNESWLSERRTIRKKRSIYKQVAHMCG